MYSRKSLASGMARIFSSQAICSFACAPEKPRFELPCCAPMPAIPMENGRAVRVQSKAILIDD